jgi:hypothetical protein
MKGGGDHWLTDVDQLWADPNTTDYQNHQKKADRPKKADDQKMGDPNN